MADFASSLSHRRFGDVHAALPIVGFPTVGIMRMTESDQPAANAAVKRAIELGMTYFDVAPEYGDGVAMARLGPALEPYRSECFLASKTMYRTAALAAIDFAKTLAALRTDYLDLYQFHSVASLDEVTTIMAKGGAMEFFEKMKAEGKVKHIGFSAHSEPAAIALIETGRVETCMFPINYGAYHIGAVGAGVLRAAKAHGVGVIALKSCARGRLQSDGSDGSVACTPPAPGTANHIPDWKIAEMVKYPVRTSSVHPNCWYEPEDDLVAIRSLLLWTLHQDGVTAVLPPGDLDILFDLVIPTLLTEGGADVPRLTAEEEAAMATRYASVRPIFHAHSEAGTKVSAEM